MKVTTLTRNAVNCITDLAMRQEQLSSLPSIAARQSVSSAYLEQIFAKLRKAGLLKAVRGPGGGYRLAREASSISVADILCALEDKVDLMACSGQQNCRSGSKCLSHDLWQQLDRHIYGYLDAVSLEMLVKCATEGGGDELSKLHVFGGMPDMHVGKEREVYSS